MTGKSGNNFILKMPVPSRCFVLLRKIKIVAAEVHIPKESRKIEKLRIFSNVSAKNNTMIQRAANTVSEVMSTSFLSVLRFKNEGNTLSSLIAYITLGLLIMEPLT